MRMADSIPWHVTVAILFFAGSICQESSSLQKRQPLPNVIFFYNWFVPAVISNISAYFETASISLSHVIALSIRFSFANSYLSEFFMSKYCKLVLSEYTEYNLFYTQYSSLNFSGTRVCLSVQSRCSTQLAYHQAWHLSIYTSLFGCSFICLSPLFCSSH